jgi:hypothetical protein
VSYKIDVESAAPPEHVSALLTRVDDVAEIPKAMRSPTEVVRAAG